MANVLVVDDETSIREFLEILLKREGHVVRSAKDAVDAVLRLKDAPADLVLTDLRLPRGSGMDVLHHVTKHTPGTQVIMMTAFATTETAVDAIGIACRDSDLHRVRDIFTHAAMTISVTRRRQPCRTSMDITESKGESLSLHHYNAATGTRRRGFSPVI